MKNVKCHLYFFNLSVPYSGYSEKRNANISAFKIRLDVFRSKCLQNRFYPTIMRVKISEVSLAYHATYLETIFTSASIKMECKI